MSIINYTPQTIGSAENFATKTVITSEHWNNIFNLLISQGNNSATAIHNMLNSFINSTIAGELGASTITGVSGTTVQAVMEGLKALIDLCYTKSATDTLLAQKQSITNANALVKTISFNSANGVFTITTQGGTVTTIDTALEKIAMNFAYDQASQSIILTLIDGTTQTIPLTALIQENDFVDSDVVDFTVTNHTVTATIKAGSITDTMLNSAVIAAIIGYKNAAATSATNAAASEANALTYKNNAATSATNAATSETNALTYKNNAATSASAASTKANDAANSATLADQKYTQASASANLASTKATEAGNSASAAATSATNAANSVAGFDAKVATANTNYDTKVAAFDVKVTNANTAIDTKVSTATTKATDAANSATTATTKASEAASSATTAATKAGEATTSAATASAGATTATAKATEAATSKDTATAKATEAKSYAVGGTGTRVGEDTDNAKYYKEQAKAIAGPYTTETDFEAHAADNAKHKVAVDCTILGAVCVEGFQNKAGTMGLTFIYYDDANAITLVATNEYTITFAETTPPAVVGDIVAFETNVDNPIFSGVVSAVTTNTITIHCTEEGITIPNSIYSIAFPNKPTDSYSHAEGVGTTVMSYGGHVEGTGNVVNVGIFRGIYSVDTNTKTINLGEGGAINLTVGDTIQIIYGTTLDGSVNA